MGEQEREPTDRGARRRSRVSKEGSQGTSGTPAGDATAPEGPSSPPAEQRTPEQRTPVTQQIGRLVVLLLVVLFGVFAAVNAHPVDFSWIFGQTEVTETAAGETSGGVPLIVLLLASFVIGAAAGAVVARQSARARRRSEGADG